MGALRRYVVFWVSIWVLNIFLCSSAKAVMYGTENADAATTQPWVVSIWESNSAAEAAKPQFICSGSLISASVVLTAAHCIDDTGLLYVKVGASTLDQKATLIPVDAAWRHPRFSGRSAVNDVGLLKLEIPATSTGTIHFVQALQAKAVSSLKSYKFSGWGLDQNGSRATFLKWVQLQNQDVTAKTKLAKYGFLQAVQIGAGTLLKKEKVYQGICNGDSGGPLTAVLNGQEVVVGVASWSLDQNNSCDANSPSVFTRLTYYSDEINAAIPSLYSAAENSTRALPRVLAAPSISGEPSVGSALKCLPGTWSKSASSYEYRWLTSYGATLGINQVFIVPEIAEGTEITCEVKGSNSRGSAWSTVKASILFRPTFVGQLKISGLGMKAPSSGDKLVCSGATWPAGYTEALTWYATDTVYLDIGAKKYIGNGSVLTVDAALRGQITGKWVHCVSTAKGPGGTSSTKASEYVSLPYAPTAWATASLKSVDTSSGAATYECTVYVSSLVSAYRTEFSWGLADSVGAKSYNTLLGTGATLRLTAEDRARYMNKILGCWATVTNEDGAATSNSFIYLPAYFLN